MVHGLNMVHGSRFFDERKATGRRTEFGNGDKVDDMVDRTFDRL